MVRILGKKTFFKSIHFYSSEINYNSHGGIQVGATLLHDPELKHVIRFGPMSSNPGLHV